MPTAQIDFTKNVAFWWRQVKTNFWDDVQAETLKLVQLLLESSMQEELVIYTQAQRHERTRQRVGYRNGSYARAVSTTLGALPAVRVPRSRDGAGSTRRYCRATSDDRLRSMTCSATFSSRA